MPKSPHPPWRLDVCPLTVVAFAVPHRVVPQLLRPAAPLRRKKVLVRTAHDAAVSVTGLDLGTRSPFEGDDDDYRLVAFTEALPHLTRINVDGGFVGDYFCHALAAGPLAARLRSLSLHNCWQVKSSALAAVSELRLLEHLDVSFTRAVDEAGATEIALSKLTSLDLSHTNITCAGVFLMSSMIALQSLSLGNCEVDAVALCYRYKHTAHIAKLNRLRSLDLSKCRTFDDKALRNLRQLTELSSLNLSSCDELQPHALEYIGMMPSLEVLDLSDCNAMQKVELLDGHPRLTTLRLQWCSGFPRILGLQALSAIKLPMLHTVDLRSSGHRDTAPVIPNVAHVLL